MKAKYIKSVLTSICLVLALALPACIPTEREVPVNTSPTASEQEVIAYNAEILKSNILVFQEPDKNGYAKETAEDLHRVNIGRIETIEIEVDEGRNSIEAHIVDDKQNVYLVCINTLGLLKVIFNGDGVPVLQMVP